MSGSKASYTKGYEAGWKRMEYYHQQDEKRIAELEAELAEAQERIAELEEELDQYFLLAADNAAQERCCQALADEGEARKGGVANEE